MTQPLTFSSAYGSRVMGVFRATTFLIALAMMVLCQWFFHGVLRKDRFFVPVRAYRFLMWLMGFHVYIHGTMATTAPVLFVANHTSYLDIPVLGSIIPASFVAKADVAGWPLIGFVSKVLNTIFIERRSTQIDSQRNLLRAALENKRSLILFPEGTSSDGLRVLPFKSSLFSIVENAPTDCPITVQPISITCTGVGGLPMPRSWRAHYAWYGDMTLVGHLWDVFKIGAFRVDVMFHPAVKANDFNNRKALSNACQEMVARGIEASLSGRDPALAQGVKLRQLALPA